MSALSARLCADCGNVKREFTDKVVELFQLAPLASEPSAARRFSGTGCQCHVDENEPLEDAAKVEEPAVKKEFTSKKPPVVIIVDDEHDVETASLAEIDCVVKPERIIADEPVEVTSGALSDVEPPMEGVQPFRCVDVCESQTDRASWWDWLISYRNCSRDFHPECVLIEYGTKKRTPSPTRQLSIIHKRQFYCSALECQDAQAAARGRKTVKRERGAAMADDVGVKEEIKREDGRGRKRNRAPAYPPFLCVNKNCLTPTDRNSWWARLITMPSSPERRKILRRSFFCPARKCPNAKARLAASAPVKKKVKRERSISAAEDAEEPANVVTIHRSNLYDMPFVSGEEFSVDTAVMNLHPLPVPETHYLFHRDMFTACLGGSSQNTFPPIGRTRFQITLLDGGQRVRYAAFMPLWNPDLPTMPGAHGSYLTTDPSDVLAVRSAWEVFAKRLGRRKGGGTWEYLGTYDILKYCLLQRDSIAKLSAKTIDNYADEIVTKGWGPQVFQAARFNSEQFPATEAGKARARRELLNGNIPFYAGLLECVGFNTRLMELLVRAKTDRRFFDTDRYQLLPGGEWINLESIESDEQEEECGLGLVDEADSSHSAREIIDLDYASESEHDQQDWNVRRGTRGGYYSGRCYIEDSSEEEH
ncbi:hypothetical protein HDU89_002582 [Geranomyces variabilis]|nr:hypothetical protein HDU89_002582 [Geranomyces variabilis]